MSADLCARDALERSIRVWLGTLDEDRLRRVDDLVMRMVAEQRRESLLNGLRELRDAPAVTPHDWPGPFELGGEGGF